MINDKSNQNPPAFVNGFSFESKLPDILEEDGYPDVQAFMATYREAEAVVERYEREVWEYNLKLKQKEKPAKKPPEKQSIREHLRQLQEQGKQQSRKKKSFDRDR